MIKKYVLLLCTLANISLIHAHESYIRSKFAINEFDDEMDDESINEPVEVRDLRGWTFVHKTYDDDRWYNSYDEEEIPDREYGDDPDFLRDTDLCFGADGRLSRQNCSLPPDCNDVNEQWFGKAMLCINRAPLLHDQNTFYVAAMKCIPRFENCDKCFCGTQRHSDGMDAYCIFDDTEADDDRVDIDCYGLERIKMMGNEYSFMLTNPSGYAKGGGFGPDDQDGEIDD